MSLETPSLTAAVSGLVRSDPHGPGITRARDGDGFRFFDPSGAEITHEQTRQRIRALRIPPAWENVWISADPLGHIQATGVDSKGRTQYLYHQVWREQRDTQKFSHMLRFASALPGLRTATQHDLRRRPLNRERVSAGVVRLIDLGLFRIGGERYAELDHHYGATTLEKRHVRLTHDGVMFDYIAKAGMHRTITVKDRLVLPTVRALIHCDSGDEALFCYEHDDGWHRLHSRDVGNYLASRAGGHYTAKEFRTWNATVLMAVVLANAGTGGNPEEPSAGHHRQRQGGGPLARGHPGGRPGLLHRSPADQPVRIGGRAARDPGAGRRASGSRRRRGRGRGTAGRVRPARGAR